MFEAICLPTNSSWSLTLLIGFVLVISLRSLYRVFIYPFYFSPYKDLPEPTGAVFPFAHAEQIRKSCNGEPYREWINTVPNKGIIRFRVLGNEERLLLTSPATLREVLVNQSYKFGKPVEAAFLIRHLLGNGLFTAEGDEHKAQRKAMVPAFAYRHIKDLYPIFWSKSKQSADAILEEQQYEVVDGKKQPQPQGVFAWAHRVTLDIIGLAGIGYDFNAVKNPNSDLVKAYDSMFGSEGPLFFWTSIGLDISLRWVLKLPIPEVLRLRRAAETIHALVEDLVAKKNREMAEKNDRSVDIASVAIRSGQFSDDDLVAQMKTFLAAGHETTSSALNWAVYLLCLHQDVQTRLREEIREKVPDLWRAEVDADLVDRLPYLNAFCNEALRFIPSIPMTMRVALEDLEICGQSVRKGTHIIVAAWAVNASRGLWGEDALVFNPDRWLPEGQANTGGAESNFSNLTFIHGPRSCIGKSFAKGEFLCLIMAWVGRLRMRFEGEPLPLDVMGWATAKPRDGLPVIFEEVKS